MKSYRNAAAALVFALMLATSALAGEIHTGVAGPNPQPTPTASSMTETVTADGEMQTGEAAPTSDSESTATEIALNLLQSVLSLF
jgi:hypothetical protein